MNDEKAAIESILYYHGADCDVQFVLRTFKQEQQASTEKVGLRTAWRLPHIRRGILIGGVALVMQATSGVF